MVGEGCRIVDKASNARERGMSGSLLGGWRVISIHSPGLEHIDLAVVESYKRVCGVRDGRGCGDSHREDLP